MKVKRISGATWMVLSRRNLLTLLAKLDGYPAGSSCTIQGGTDAWGFFVRAEEDDVHYADRPSELPTPWGPMHPETEERLRP